MAQNNPPRIGHIRQTRKKNSHAIPHAAQIRSDCHTPAGKQDLITQAEMALRSLAISAKQTGILK